MKLNYAPKCLETKWNWKRSGTFELRVTTGVRPPWVDKKALRAAQASGSTLEWDLRTRPLLWRSVELWAWAAGRQENPKQAELFAIDRQDPMSHLDMADYLGEAKVVYLAADCTDANGSIDEPSTFVYTLALWFSIDIEKVFFGQQEEKTLQRRKLLWALGERAVGWLTLVGVQVEVDRQQESLALDDQDDVDDGGGVTTTQFSIPKETSVQQEVLAKIRSSGFTCRKCSDGGMIAVDDRGITVCFKCDTQIPADAIDQAIAGDTKAPAAEPADQAVQPGTVHPLEVLRAPAAEPAPVAKVLQIKPAKRDLAAELRRALRPVLDKDARDLAEHLGISEEEVVKVVKDDPAFQVRRFRPYATSSMTTRVSLKNLALRPMFEDPELEAQRLEACRTDMARHAAACLAEAHAVYTDAGLDRSGEVAGRIVSQRVAAVMDAGDISSELYRALMDRPGEFRLVDVRGNAVARMPADMVSPATWGTWSVSPAQPPVVARQDDELEPAEAKPAEPEVGQTDEEQRTCHCTMFVLENPDADIVAYGVRHSRNLCEELVVQWPDLEPPDPVDVRMARMDKRILDAMVESLRNACFDRAAHNVAYDCNRSVTCTTQDVLRLAEADPRFTVEKYQTGPARIQLVSDPTIGEVMAEIKGWLRAADGHRMGKGEMATRIQERWGLRLPSIGRAWLDLAMRGHDSIVDLGAKGIGLREAT